MSKRTVWARVALQALGGGTDGYVDNLMLTSPAVGDEVREPGQEYHGALDAELRGA